jgi:O-antigen biosynthesis protein
MKKNDILVIARAAENNNGYTKKIAKKKLVSIIMLTFNQLKITRQCINSLFRYTKHPFELIIVDNGSTYGTVKYIKKIKSAKIILNSKNLAFSKGNNQGIRIAKGDYILLLNNDVVVTDGWLPRMMECLESDKAIGLVGPQTNAACFSQRISNPDYKNLDELKYYAQAFRMKYSGNWLETHRIIGFCMLMRKEVIEKIGLLDERFGPGGFEDFDYCLRARQAGYKIMVAGDVYIHHIGGASSVNEDFSKFRDRNREIFIDKWCRKSLEFLENI